MNTDPDRNGSDAKNAVAGLEAAAGDEDSFGESPESEGGAESLRLPELDDYNLKVSWDVYMATFLFSAIRQAICNSLTASGIDDETSAVNMLAKAVQSFGILLSAFWGCQTLLGPRCRSPMIVLFAVWSTSIYALVFAFNPRVASLTVIPNIFLALVIGISWSQRGFFAFMLMMSFLSLQVMLTFIINSFPLIQSQFPKAVQQLLVPALKMFYLAFVTEVMTFAWKKMYQRPCSPHILTALLLVALVSAETMGVVGLLSVVDSADVWSNAAIFCVTTIVMETNSRSGIFMSLLFKLMGKKYRFSHATHIFRWGKMWSSYSWICAFSGFVVPALIFGLRVEGSKFTFLRWEPWALLGIYVVQQMVTDFIYVCLQHYIRPSPWLSQTAARCLVLGEATPLFGENEHLGDDGRLRSPKTPVEGEFEPAGFKLGPWMIARETLLMFIWFEYTMSVWNNYVRGQFCVYGTFLPSEAGSCD